MHVTQFEKFDGNYNGAMGGIFDLEKPGKTIIGDPKPGDVFAYLFRRFGYPRHGWDGQKSLVIYYLTTSMEGVILSVHPDITGAGTFGYVLRDDVDRACNEEQFKPYTDWNIKCEAWILKEHGIEIVTLLEQDDAKLKRVWDRWGADKKDEDFIDPTDAHKHFFIDQEAIRTRCVTQYKEIEPFPAPVAPQDQPDNTILKQCHTALCNTIQDLKRPVYVRDVLINITGRLEYIEDNTNEAIPFLEQAGIGIGTKLDNK